MNPTPVVTSSTGPQQLSNQKQEILPEEFETQLAGYLKKEQPSTIHKEVSESEEPTDEESDEESIDETLNLDLPLLYTGLFNTRQEQQPAEASLNESSKTEVIQLLKSSEPTFNKQVNVETEKIAAFVQNKDQVKNSQQNQFDEFFVEPLTKEVTEPQASLKDIMVMSKEPTDGTLRLDKQLIYTGLINQRQEQKTAEVSLNESSKTEVIQLLKSSEPPFDKQANVETEKIAAFDQNDSPVKKSQQNLIEESIVKPVMKEVTETQTSLIDKMVMSEEPTDETLNLDKQLIYTGLINQRQESQPAEMKQNEPSKNEVVSSMKSSELTFDKQVNSETEKMVTFIQNEDLITNRQQNLLEESNMESITKKVIEPQVILKNEMVMNEELVQTEKVSVSKPTIAIESVQISVKKETVIADTILSTGRFLTAEWKNGRIVNQPIAELDNVTVNSLNELPTQTTKTPVDSVQQLEADIDGRKSTVLTETFSTESVLKNLVSRSKKSESYEPLTTVTEVDTQGQPVQQQQIVDVASIKQSNVVEPVRQAGIQQIREVVMQQAETVLSGKQSIAHVTLTPERMGEVKITVELKDNVLITKIVVDTMETKELLANGMHQLTDKLDRQNIRLGDLTIQLNENASSHFTSQERQGKEKKSTFGQQKINGIANEKETLKSEDIVENNTKRLSILV